MKKLIQELFRRMILETINDKDVIDFNDINLTSEFNRLNGLLFGSEIAPIPIRWGMDKNLIGTVYYAKDESGKEIIRGLRMSRFYDLTYGQFKNTLAHEMIHVYLSQQGIEHEHDEPFLKEMNRINGMGLGFNITVSEELDDYPDISSHVKGKELVFFTFEDGGSNYILVISKDTYKDKKRVISNAFNGSGGFWLSSNVLLRNFPVQKILGSNIKFNLISDDMLNKLFVDSKKIK